MKLRLTKLLTPQFAAWVIAIIAASGLLGFRLGLLLPGGLAPIEQRLPTFSTSLHAIWNQPFTLPVTLSRLFIAALVPSGDNTASRLPSAILGLLVILVAYWLLRKWYNYRLALFGSVLLATAPWFLHVSRLATNDILYPLGMIIILALSALWHQKERRLRLLYISALGKAFMLYVPGGIWLLLCLFLVERRNIIASLKAGKRHTIFSLLMIIVLLVPLGHGLIQNWHLYTSIIGLPASLPSITQFGQRFAEVWEHIFIHGYNNPLFNVGGLAIVDALTSLAFIVGVYLYAQHAKASRSRLLLSLWLVATALIALNNSINIALIMPIVAVLATGGIGYLLHLWLKVFPRNPLARTFGISMVGLMIVFAATYNVRNYYEAWPHSPATEAAFHVQQ